MFNEEIYFQNYLSLQIWLNTNVAMPNAEISIFKIIGPCKSDFKLSDGCLQAGKIHVWSLSYIQSALCFVITRAEALRSPIMCLYGTNHFHKTTPLQGQDVVL